METINGSLFLPGSTALLEHLDKKVMIILRDSKHLIGILRSFDHFMNITLESTFERIMLKEHKVYCDHPVGVYIVRGDNIVLLGEVDDEKDANNPGLRKIDVEELMALHAEGTETETLAPTKNPVVWDCDS